MTCLSWMSSKAVDSWHETGHSTANVGSKRQEPKHGETAAGSLVDYNACRAEKNEDEKDAVYPRKVKRKKEGHAQWKAIHLAVEHWDAASSPNEWYVVPVFSNQVAFITQQQ